jgi:ATP-dependent DNA helicase RecG
VQKRLDVRNSTTEVLVGMQRIDVPLLPLLLRRESIANAIVHRDYSQLGPITVQLTDSSFTVSSPGGFPPGVTIGNILEQSRPRSQVLANAFMRAGLVERKGKGVNEMFESQLRAGRDAPDYSRTTNDAVVVSVPLGSADLDLVRFLATYQDQQQRNLSLDELRIVHEVKTSGPATSAELSEYLGIAVAPARATANGLTEAGILEARGSGRSRRFHLTARFYDLAEDRAAYVRVRTMDPLQQRQMVLDYVQTFGRITRGQAAELCQLTASEARRLLKSLVDEGRLELRGERRGAYYVLTDSH